MLKKISKKTYLIELAKLGGMIFYILISILTWIVSPSNDSPLSTILSSGRRKFITGYLVITLLFIFLNYQSKKNIIPKKFFAFLIVPVSYLLSFVWIFLSANLNGLFQSRPLFYSPLLFYKALGLLIIVIAFAGLYYLIN